jgi:hypothetical protein
MAKVQRTSAHGVRALVLALALSSCLPEGGPGIGARWLETRGVGALVAPAAEGAGEFIVFARRDRETQQDFGPAFQLFSLGEAGSAPAAVGTGINGFASVANGGQQELAVWDARNRLWGLRAINSPVRSVEFALLRTDLATGTTTDLGRAIRPEVAPDGRTVLVTRADAATDVYDVDDHVLHIERGVGVVKYLGSSLLYTDAIGLHQLALPPIQPPRLLVPKVRTFVVVPGRESEQLLLVDVVVAMATGNDAFPTRQIGLVRAAETTPTFAPLAEGRFLAPPVLSDEGDRIALLDRTGVSNEVRVRIVDLRSGVEMATTFVASRPDPLPPEIGGPGRDPDALRPPQVEAAFRPRHDDLWIFQDGELAAIVAAGVLTPLPRSGRQTSQSSGLAYSLDDRSLFTSDGRFWIFVDAQPRVRLADANDPLGPPVLDLTETNRGTVLLRQIDGGRNLLIFTSQDDRELLRTDLDARRLSRLARDVGQVEVGRTRAIAIVDKLSGDRSPGRLVSLDLATGEQTRLGDNVVEFTLRPVCPTCDPTGSGVEIQYVVQARLPYRHDGIWKATLP